MKLKIGKRLRGIIFKLLITMIAIVVLVVIFISPLTKWAVEKYDYKYTNREIKMDWAYVNPFTGYIHFDGLKIFEYKSDSHFITMKGLSANFEIFKMINKTYEISSIKLDEPSVKVSQIKKVFNFADVINKLIDSTKKKFIDTTKAPTKFNCLDIDIKNGSVYYQDEGININYYVKKVNIYCKGYRYNSDSLDTKFSFLSGPGSGSMEGKFKMNLKTRGYALNIKITKFDLSIFEQYLKSLAKYGKFRANLDLLGDIDGNFRDAQNLNAKGNLAINDFHFGKNKTEDFVSFEKLFISINKLNPKAKKYLFDSLTLAKPRFVYEKYDELDNIRQMFGKKGEKIKNMNQQSQQINIILIIAQYFRDLSKNFFKSDYDIKKMRISNADFKYVDYTYGEKFQIEMYPFNLITDDVDREKSILNVKINSKIIPYGGFTSLINLNPKNIGDMDVKYRFEDVSLPVFNPILQKYTSFPLDRGTLEFKGNIAIRDSNVASLNHLIFVDPRIGNRIKRKDNKWLPLPLIMGFVRENGNVIDYEIPINGSLKNPEFKFKDVISDLINNIFLKPVTLPYRLNVKSVERKVERGLTIKWDARQTELYPSQRRYLKKIANFMEDNKDVSFTIQSVPFVDKEWESILFYESKKRFYIFQNKIKDFTEDDSFKVVRLSNKDAQYANFINSTNKDKLIYTIQQKAENWLGTQFLQGKYNYLMETRRKVVLNYFKEKELNSRIKIGPMVKEIPYYGFSYYKINYKGKLPDVLLKSVDDLKEFNEEDPRKPYKPIREKKGFFRKLFGRK